MTTNEPVDDVVPTGDEPETEAPYWWIFRGDGRPLHDVRLDEVLPKPPPWRRFPGGRFVSDEIPADDGEIERRLGREHQMFGWSAESAELDMINAAICLRKPLIVSGPPGAGKSSLAFRIARELHLGRVVRWHITSRTTLKDGLYHYDAIGRAEAAARQARFESPADPPGEGLGDFVRLGPLGTALLPSTLPRVLLIDEFDKSEADLPNDLLGIFETGSFPIPELERVRRQSPEVTVFTDDPDRTATIGGGRVQCFEFPIIILTSNGEREFPRAFLRRCLELELSAPGEEELATIAAAHLGDMPEEQRTELVKEFVRRADAEGGIPADRLLEAMYLATSGAYDRSSPSWPRLRDALWRQLRTMV